MVEKIVSNKKTSEKSKRKKVLSKKEFNSKKIGTKILQPKTIFSNVNKNTNKNVVHIKVVSNKGINPLYIYALIVICVLLVSVIYFAFFYSPYKYNFDIRGIQFHSNTYTPTEFYNEFRQNNVVYVSPMLTENNPDQLTANAMNLWQVVLIGNDIDAIQLVRVLNENSVLDYCYTNDGNVNSMRQISGTECTSIINDSGNAVIFIDEGKNEVILEKNKLRVLADIRVVSQVNFAVIQEIFPNAQTILDTVNEKIYGIN